MPGSIYGEIIDLLGFATLILFTISTLSSWVASTSGDIETKTSLYPLSLNSMPLTRHVRKTSSSNIFKFLTRVLLKKQSIFVTLFSLWLMDCSA